MAFSYTRIILENTEKTIYDRGFEYVKGQITLLKTGNDYCMAIAKGSNNYEVYLGFTKFGNPKYTCSCPYFSQHKDAICKHIIGASLAWDRFRDVPDPDKATVSELTIPEPDFTSKDINAAFKDPLNANLDILRADPTGWMRPHARLPIKPKICYETLRALQDIKSGLSEIRSWARKYNYDTYFCAGEMMAGFCELIRWLEAQHSKLLINDSISAIKYLVDFHHELVLEKIDDSDGIHIFSENHLKNLIDQTDKIQKLTREQYNHLNIQREKIEDY